MIVNVVLDTDPPYALVEGICSDRALGVLLRAIRPWGAFGRYNHVVVDLTHFDDWLPGVAEQLASAVTVAGDADHWLAFFPVDDYRLRGIDSIAIHCYPDRAHAHLAMRDSSRRHQRRTLLRWRIWRSRMRAETGTVFGVARILISRMMAGRKAVPGPQSLQVDGVSRSRALV